MGASFKIFHLVEAGEPHPLVARTLNDDLWEKCQIESPVPIHFVPMPRWSGWCHEYQNTKEGEVHLNEDLLSTEKNARVMEDRLVYVYLHELSHRLAPGHDHDAAFFAVSSLLLMRAGHSR